MDQFTAFSFFLAIGITGVFIMSGIMMYMDQKPRVYYRTRTYTVTYRSLH